MRAAVDVTPLIGARTGIGEFVDGLVAALQQRHDIEVVPVAFSWRGRGEAGVAHLPIPARAVQRLWTHTNLFPVQRWVGQVDVVHGTNYVVGPPARAPRIVTVHDLATVKTPELCHRNTLVFPTLVRRAVNSGAFVQTDTQTVADEVTDWLGVEPARVRVVYPGVPSIGHGTPDGLDPRVINNPFVLTVGTEDPRKGLVRVARALTEMRSAVPGLHWVHAGGSGWGTEQLTDALSALRQSDRAAVVRLGRVTNDQRAWLLRHATVFLYPSVDEGFGFPPLEALSVGTPVVAQQLPVLQEVLGRLHDQSVHLVETEEPSTLTAAVMRAMSDSHRAEAITMYSWAQMAADQVQWYRDVQP